MLVSDHGANSTPAAQSAGRLTVLFVACALASLVAGPSAHGEQPNAGRLTVTVEGVRNSHGVVGVLVFNSREGWPERVDAAAKTKAVPAQPPVTSVSIEGVPYGDCAVVVLHDENENMKLDRNFVGVPREGWGMSNNPKARTSAPSFRRARFVLRRDTHVRVRLNY